ASNPQAFLELIEAAKAEEDVADDQQRPAFSDDLEGAGDGAVLCFVRAVQHDSSIAKLVASRDGLCYGPPDSFVTQLTHPGVQMAGLLSPKPRTAVLLALCLAVFTINLDTTIVNVALPTLVRELHASTRQLQWIVDAYSLVFAALVLAAGSISDRVGRKGALLAGLAIFGTGSLVGSRCT